MFSEGKEHTGERDGAPKGKRRKKLRRRKCSLMLDAPNKLGKLRTDN